MNRLRWSAIMLLACATAIFAAPPFRLPPPLWVDRDDHDIPKPQSQQVSELHAILYNTWVRHLSPEYLAVKARDQGALNINAWDEVPDSTWFTNRIGRHALSFEEIVQGLEGKGPEAGEWLLDRLGDEGYTPKLRIRDSVGRRYWLKFDLPKVLERNSAAERIATLILHAAGYNVPHNSISRFYAAALHLDQDAQYRDSVGNRRPLTPDDLEAALSKLKPMPDSRYRGLASLVLPGEDLGKFKYEGTRKDDPNDLIPHELRRELRGLRVVASWINHVDVGDKNTQDMYCAKGDGRRFVKHYLLDFGSALGSGDFTNGPYRVGHEYLFDGAATGHALVTLGIWRRPWEVYGEILYPEVGYFQAELFEPEKWKPNYPNLSFVRMDDGDAYWGAKIVTAFSDEAINKLVETGEFGRLEVAHYVANVLKARRDAIGHHWLDKITALEDFTLAGSVLRFRDLATERGYVESPSRQYRLWVEDLTGKKVSQVSLCKGIECSVPGEFGGKSTIDRYGREPLARVMIQSSRRNGTWALPVEVFLGRNQGGSSIEVLGWRHAAK